MQLRHAVAAKVLEYNQMARKVINIGTTGNDATGDSIREGFNKVNQNFTEIYASLGLGGGLTFSSLDDTPSTLAPNKKMD